MMNKLKDLWNSSGRWFLLGLPAAVVIAAIVWQANRMLTPPRADHRPAACGAGGYL